MANKERTQEIIENLKTDIPKYPDPLPQNMKLFDHIAKQFAGKKPSSSKGPHFGRALRFEKSEEELWKAKIKLYNEHSDGPKVDIKKGPKPGVGEYNLIEKWKGKKVERRGMQRAYSADPKAGERILKVASKLPSRSIYNPRVN